MQWGGGHEVPCLAEEMLTTDSFCRQGVGFKGKAPGMLTKLQRMATPKSIWVHKLDLIGFLKQTERGHKAGWLEGGGLWRICGSDRKYDQSICYKILEDLSLYFSP